MLRYGQYHNHIPISLHYMLREDVFFLCHMIIWQYRIGRWGHLLRTDNGPCNDCFPTCMLSNSSSYFDSTDDNFQVLLPVWSTWRCSESHFVFTGKGEYNRLWFNDKMWMVDIYCAHFCVRGKTCGEQVLNIAANQRLVAIWPIPFYITAPA